ncbi:hypothetical protein PGB90_001834 [Kerria lacca]
MEISLVAIYWLLQLINDCLQTQANPEARRLYDDLLTNYNRLIRPVGNNSDRLTVKMGLSLSQLIEVNLKNQIMIISVWVEQEWNDYKLKWNPDDYGGIDYLHVPSEHIWLPDIVLYNNADGNYELTIMTKAMVYYTGRVVWKPPAIYKSFCEIDLEYFPFDEQTCLLKFGSWSYDGYKLDLQHMSGDPNSDTVDYGMDLQDFYLSVEWDVMKVPAVRHEEYYSCCEEPYIDIVFNLTVRRKTLFYTVNLIIPCVGLSFLSVLVFYLPSDSGEKVSLCISVLVSLTVFFLLLSEIIPPTSLVVPLLGKYLLFTMVLVTLSVVVTIIVLNVNFRSPVTHRMRPWVYKIFIQVLPKMLFIERPIKDKSDNDDRPEEVLTGVFEMPRVDGFLPYAGRNNFPNASNIDYSIPTLGLPAPRYDTTTSTSTVLPSLEEMQFNNDCVMNEEYINGNDPDISDIPEVPDISGTNASDGSPIFETDRVRSTEKAVEDAKFIAQHVKNKNSFDEVIEDWKYIAMVLDRLFLWIFALACIMGTALIILQAPVLYDTTKPIDIIYSKIAKKKLLRKMLTSKDY